MFKQFVFKFPEIVKKAQSRPTHADILSSP